MQPFTFDENEKILTATIGKSSTCSLPYHASQTELSIIVVEPVDHESDIQRLFEALSQNSFESLNINGRFNLLFINWYKYMKPFIESQKKSLKKIVIVGYYELPPYIWSLLLQFQNLEWLEVRAEFFVDTPEKEAKLPSFIDGLTENTSIKKLIISLLRQDRRKYDDENVKQSENFLMAVIKKIRNVENLTMGNFQTISVEFLMDFFIKNSLVVDHLTLCGVHVDLSTEKSVTLKRLFDRKTLCLIRIQQSSIPQRVIDHVCGSTKLTYITLINTGRNFQEIVKPWNESCTVFNEQEKKLTETLMNILVKFPKVLIDIIVKMVFEKRRKIF